MFSKPTTYILFWSSILLKPVHLGKIVIWPSVGTLITATLHKVGWRRVN